MSKIAGKSESIYDIASDNDQVRKILADTDLGHVDVSNEIKKLGFNIGESSIRRYRKKMNIKAVSSKNKKLDAAEAKNDTYVSISGDSGELSVGIGEIPVELKGDFAPLLEFFGLSPETYQVLDNTVRVSKWQQSKRTEDGDRDVIWLWSYKARFIRKSADLVSYDRDMNEAISQVKAWKPLIRKSPGKGLGAPCTYVHVQGDEQIGKSAGGGIEGFEKREAEALQKSYERLTDLLNRGFNIECIADVVTGDKIENIFGHYPSQSKTTSTLRQQMSYARQSEIRKTRMFAEFGLPVKKVYTPSNHGEIRQAIGLAPYTSDSDNYDLIIAEQVKEVINESNIADQVEWYIPHDEWWTFFQISGIQAGLTHGHKADGKGTIDKWVREQRDHFNFHQQIRMQIAFMGHKHHGFIKDIGGTTIVQSPALDGGSTYFEAGFGVRSNHGIVSLLVGDQFRFGWSDAAMI